MSESNPIQIPTKAPQISPETEVEANPERLCEPQKEKLTRELAPLLPD